MSSIARIFTSIHLQSPNTMYCYNIQHIVIVVCAGFRTQLSNNNIILMCLSKHYKASRWPVEIKQKHSWAQIIIIAIIVGAFCKQNRTTCAPYNREQSRTQDEQYQSRSSAHSQIVVKAVTQFARCMQFYFNFSITPTVSVCVRLVRVRLHVYV